MTAAAAGLELFERYRPLVGDWEAFAEACRRPLPPCAWARPGRVVAPELGRRLAAAGFEPEPVAWCPDAWRLAPGLEGTESPGNSLEFVAGLCHLQEEASLLPPLLLDARPGDRVLDLCAAPGGKSARIAAAMAGRGTLVANDRSRPRLGPLRRTLARLGYANVVITSWDAASYPRAAGRFDRVLADVPCSCEGTSRKNPEVLAPREGRERLARLQRAILAAAVRLCRPGGRIVYSTCTYAPEENEAVVDAALAATGGALRLVPARVVGLAAEPGLTEWRGASFDPSLSGALRLWPHAAGTGGFFAAVLEKAADAEEADEPPGAAGETAFGPWREEPPGSWLGRLDERFGLPAELFAGHRLVRRGRKRVTLVPEELAPTGSPEPVAIGLPLIHPDARPPKPTTAAAMAFGGAAVRNVVEAGDEQAGAYLAGEPFEPAPGAVASCTGPGLVLVRCRGLVLGVGRWSGAESAGAAARVESLYPRGWRVAKGRLVAGAGTSELGAVYRGTGPAARPV